LFNCYDYTEIHGQRNIKEYLCVIKHHSDILVSHHTSLRHTHICVILDPGLLTVSQTKDRDETVISCTIKT